MIGMRTFWLLPAALAVVHPAIRIAAADKTPVVVEASWTSAKPRPAQEIQQAQAVEALPLPRGTIPLPAYARMQSLPIDLPTVLRLVNANNPTIGYARARIAEAQARLDLSNLQWVPNLSGGTSYNRFDGQTQNQRGEVFSVSRANLFSSGGVLMAVDTADAIYRPIIDRRLLDAERWRAESVTIGTEFEAVSSYLDLVFAYAHLDINRDTLEKAEAMLTAARNAAAAKLDRTAGDVNRAQTEVLFRKTERVEIEGRIGAISGRLGRLLLLPPMNKIVPVDAGITPVSLIDPNSTLDDLVAIAIDNRPDLRANRALIAAAWSRVRRQQSGPLLPKVAISNQTGSFGGGVNDDLQQFDARNAVSAQVFWELRNLGFGNAAEVRERRALLDQAQMQALETQARATAEIVEAAQQAAARLQALDLAEKAVKEATDLYRISKDGTTNVLDAKNLFDALRPLQAIQFLNQARLNYLTNVIEFNRAQYRLYTALGNPPDTAPR